ncbi:hypothetical protein AA0114_g12254 [Alternaria tenuissima]|uniref:Uncharacterized protein n=1 Tax=Alternaria tenuissima TaxID=119927 RepID=A0A4Q4M1T0_9PLEO|nr:hypothetical protein AA0114_g12254 [Alternaria tenuissima]
MEVNGRFVVNPPKSVEDDNDRIPSRLGPRTDAAVLKLTDGYLSSGEYYMGRWVIEPRALLPMQVFWAKDQQSVQPCQRDGPEEDPQLKTNGCPFGTSNSENDLVALLLEGMGRSEIKLHFQ